MKQPTPSARDILRKTFNSGVDYSQEVGGLEPWDMLSIDEALAQLEKAILEIIEFTCNRPNCDCRWIKDEQRQRLTQWIKGE